MRFQPFIELDLYQNGNEKEKIHPTGGILMQTTIAMAEINGSRDAVHNNKLLDTRKLHEMNVIMIFYVTIKVISFIAPGYLNGLRLILEIE